MSLNDTKIRHLKPLVKPFKVSDAHGLYLLVNPNGSRRWSHHHAARLLASITNHIFPAIGQMPTDALKPHTLLLYSRP